MKIPVEKSKKFRRELKNYKSKARERTDEVKEKMKKRQKLSTEDILAFQAIKN